MDIGPRRRTLSAFRSTPPGVLALAPCSPANAPGYILDVDEDARLFRSLGDGNGCSEYDPWAALEVLVWAKTLSIDRTRNVGGFAALATWRASR